MKISQALRITRNDVVAFVGGGGKTTAIFRLADELANDSSQKMRVLTTTSTRIFATQIKRAPAHVTFDPEQQTITDILPHLDTALAKHNQVLLIGRTDPESGKAFGVPPEIIDALAATGHFDAILNEADGSRMRPFKAPADHEPVIPRSTTLVVPVVGLDVWGQLLNNDIIHRAERVSQLSGNSLNQPVTAGTIATVLGHPQGGLKNVPTQARVVPLLNKVESPKKLAVAQEIATKLLAYQRIKAVTIGAVQIAEIPLIEVHSRTAVVVLAAGGSSRFGSPKQLAHWNDKTFIEQVVDTALASQADTVVVVLGAEIEQSRAVLGNRPVHIVINNAWAKGQSTSLKAGLATLPPAINSVVFLLVDLPGIKSESIDSVIERHRQTLAPVVWPEFEGKRGNPVLFDRALFPELMQVNGDMGGKPVLMAYKDKAEQVKVTDKAVLQDFDRPEHLADIKENL